MRLTGPILRRIEGLSTEARRPGGLSTDELLSEMGALLDLDQAGMYAFTAEDRPAVAFLDFTGFASEALRRTLDAALALSPEWSYHPARTSPAERNRPRTFVAGAIGALCERLPAMDYAVSRHPWFLNHQLRTLVCDGPALLAWVGGFREGARGIGDRERAILSRLGPALRGRLRHERDFGRGRLDMAVLSAALDEIPAPAFVVGVGGKVMHANAAGRALLDAGASEAAALRAALAAESHPRFRWTRLEVLGMPLHFLAVERSPAPAALVRASRWVRRWDLTPRQGEVLTLLSRGQANKTIAATLGCGEATVEFHVTALLAKAGCDSRAALVARFWAEE